MFEYRKYTIRFKKEFDSEDGNRGFVVTDATIMEYLHALQEKYKFSIAKIRLKDIFHNSSITIKCKRGEEKKIFIDLCRMLGSDITDVHF